MIHFKKASLAICVLMLITSCTPGDFFNNNNCDTLKFSSATIHVADAAGSFTHVSVKSNISWQLSVQPPAQSWVSLSRASGHNNSELTVTATTDNRSGGYRFATIIATPVNSNTVQPVQVLLVQYDSTAHGN